MEAGYKYFIAIYCYEWHGLIGLKTEKKTGLKFCQVLKLSLKKYRKIPMISPGLIFVQKAFLLGLFSEGLVIGRNFAFQNGFGLSIKTSSSNSPWAYIREGLLSEG